MNTKINLNVFSVFKAWMTFSLVIRYFLFSRAVFRVWELLNGNSVACVLENVYITFTK